MGIKAVFQAPLEAMHIIQRHERVLVESILPNQVVAPWKKPDEIDSTRERIVAIPFHLNKGYLVGYLLFGLAILGAIGYLVMRTPGGQKLGIAKTALILVASAVAAYILFGVALTCAKTRASPQSKASNLTPTEYELVKKFILKEISDAEFLANKALLSNSPVIVHVLKDLLKNEPEKIGAVLLANLGKEKVGLQSRLDKNEGDRGEIEKEIKRINARIVNLITMEDQPKEMDEAEALNALKNYILFLEGEKLKWKKEYDIYLRLTHRAILLFDPSASDLPSLVSRQVEI